MINRSEIDRLSIIGLGTGRLSSLGGALSQKECNDLIKSALDYKITVLDTADTYGSGDAERMLGKAINGCRNEFFVITKSGFPYVSLPGFLSPINQVGKKILQRLGAKKDYSKKYLIKSLQKSLKRLNTDAVNAFVLHEPFISEVTDESWEALHIIKSSGMAQVTGVSTSDHEVVKDGIAAGKIEIIETPVSLLEKNTSDLIIDLAVEHDIPVIANQILNSYHSISVENKWKIDQLIANHGLSEDLIEILITYVISKPGIVCGLIGTKNKYHLIKNAKINVLSHFENFYNDIKLLNL